MNNKTFAPLPTFSDLYNLFKKNKFTLENIFNVKKNNIYYFSRSSWSLRFIVELKLLQKNKNINIWLPDYYCNHTTLPIRSSKINILFYKINEDLTPDYEWCYSKAKYSKPDIFVHVHYFGKIISVRKSSIFCKIHNSWLIEDAAQCLFPIINEAFLGDFILYSPHKHFAIPNGAILIINDKFHTQINIKYQYTKFISLYKNNLSHTLFWFIKRTFQYFFVLKLNIEDLYPINSNYNQNNKYLSPVISKISKKMIAINYYRITDIANKRIINHNKWGELLKKALNLSTSTNFLNPYLFILDFSNSEESLKIYNYFKRNNLPVTSWPDLANEIFQDEENHLVAINMRKNKIFLSIHHTLDVTKYNYKWL